MHLMEWRLEAVEDADSDMDHYLVRVKYRQKIDCARQSHNKTQERFDVDKFKKYDHLREEYSNKMTQKFEETSEQWEREETEGNWRLLKETLQTVTEEVAGRRKQENDLSGLTSAQEQ